MATDQKPLIESEMERMPSNIARPAFYEVSEIDDTLVIDFSLEKFNSITFTAKKQTKLLFEDRFPLFVQSVCAPIFYVLFHAIFVLRIKGKEHLAMDVRRGDSGQKQPILFISNHVGFYDSFMFDLFVRPFSSIMPFRFMGTTRFIVPFLAALKLIGIIDLVYFLFGVFRVTPGEGAEKSLKKAYEIIKNHGTVVMYPEGRIWKPTNVHPEEIGPFKWGAAILAKNTGVKIIPVSIKKTVRTDSKGFMKVRRAIDINIGEAFYADPDMAPELIADEMREKVLGLYEKTR